MVQSFLDDFNSKLDTNSNTECEVSKSKFFLPAYVLKEIDEQDVFDILTSNPNFGLDPQKIFIPTQNVSFVAEKNVLLPEFSKDWYGNSHTEYRNITKSAKVNFAVFYNGDLSPEQVSMLYAQRDLDDTPRYILRGRIYSTGYKMRDLTHPNKSRRDKDDFVYFSQDLYEKLMDNYDLKNPKDENLL